MNLLRSLLNDAGSPGHWLTLGIDAAGKAAILIAVAGLVALALRRASAASRHLAWCLGLAGALALPAHSMLLPGWSLRVLPERAETHPLEDERNASNSTTLAASTLPLDGSLSSGAPAALDRPHNSLDPLSSARALAVSQPPAPASRTSRPTILARALLALWGVGALAVLLPLAAALLRTRRLSLRSRRLKTGPWVDLARELGARLGRSRPVALFQGDPGVMPMTWGIVRPAVLLPAEADTWPVERRRVVLLHELAHVRRRDCLTQALARLACAFYWFNPLAWLAARRLLVERERACDDLVLRAGERPTAYADQLLAIARTFRTPSAVSAAAVAMARPSQLEGRLRAILDATISRRLPARWLAATALIAMLLGSATLAAIRLEAREREPRAITGIVLGGDGQPLAGAELTFFHSRPQMNKPADVWPTQRLGRATSDANGRFRLEFDLPDPSTEDRYDLVATASDHGIACRRLTDPTDPPDDPIRLPAEQAIDVSLVDLEGMPVAEASVRLLYIYPATGGDGLGRNLLTSPDAPDLASRWTSDDRGRFTLRGVGPEHAYSLQIEAPGFGRQMHHLKLTDGQSSATVALSRARIIEGRVTLADSGAPAVGARIEADTMSEPYGTGMFMGRAETLTDSDGRYRVEAAPGGSFRVAVRPPTDIEDPYLMRGRLVVPDESVRSTADFALPRGVLVRGRVVESGDGRPVVGATVTHEVHERNNPFYIDDDYWFNGDETRSVTDADGRYRLAVMPGPGYLMVKAASPDYIRKEITNVDLHGQLIWPNWRNYPDAFHKLDTRPDAGPVDVDLTLRRGATLRGRLVGHDGQPIRQAALFSRWYLPIHMMTHNGSPELPIRGDRFELGGCDPDGSAPVFFLDAATRRGAVVELSGAQTGEDLQVTLRPCGSATVRFVDSDGQPLVGQEPGHIEVVLTPGVSFADATRVDGESLVVADAFHVANLDRERYRDLKTDADGRMTFPTLIPGATYRVSVYNQPKSTQVEFTVQPGEARDLGELAIEKPRSAG